MARTVFACADCGREAHSRYVLRCPDCHGQIEQVDPLLVASMDALESLAGLVPAGHGWCPVHGDALCPEGYMLRQDGTVAPGYQQHWSDDLRCGQRQPTYRRVQRADG